ncbi:CCAAT/enhancer-binding protein zeta [Dichanthelium oligosanthes]|uniref:CCAAT/enhancer-binding protein zeta n=1 Tax=Dichanthelium oligosanthes TaxID=888268 RepID=A0A1E5UQZ7_9POAL|nr:CCAAT/enhancer-binding protein zeta [Dichanthelium oligosanthes]
MAEPNPKPKRTKKSKKPSAPGGDGEDMDALKSDVATFASSLGFLPGAGGSSGGFDDSDFRKSGPMKKPPKPSSEQPQQTPENTAKPHQNPRPSKKPHPLELHGPHTTTKPGAVTTNYPLMKAAALSGQWFTDADELESRVLGGRKHVPPAVGLQEMKGMVERKRELAEKLMAQYAREYDMVRRGHGDLKLLEISAKSGTSSDKVSAFTCLVEDNPIANMRALDSLLGMVTSKVGKRYAFTGFDALKELFLTRLLPDRKLKSLIQRPLDILPETKDGYSLLLFWHWEDCLKQRYEKFVMSLEDAVKDMLPNLKDKAMKTVFILLKSKSEQERRLLTALVNKLGDPERRAASSAAYLLTCLLATHPNMKVVVIDEVDSFLFRPHVGLRAKYQAVNFLSQILLTHKGDGPKIAKRLVDVYIALFKVLMSSSDTKGETGNKYSKKNVENGKIEGGNNKVKDSKSHGNNKVSSTAGSDLEMDSRILSALLTGVNRALPYVASSEVDDIVEVQTPILFRLVHAENFNIGVQALMLLFQISTKNQIASDRFYRALYAKLLSPAAVTSSKVALQRPPQYACGCLFILSEVLKAKSPLWAIVLQNESVDDGDEHFEDIVESPEDSTIALAVLDKHNDKLAAHEKYNSHAGDGSDSVKQMKLIEKDENDRVSWWELTVLASHVHPSVSTMARTLLSGNNIVYSGDPLTDLSLAAFLDKFMEKKPKGNRIAEGKWHGGSQIAPAKKLDMNHRLIGEELLELAENEVPPEDIVFHRFYMNKSGPVKTKAKRKGSDVDEDTGELLADNADDASDESGDEMQDLGDGLAEDEEYDYDDLDSNAFDEENELLGDDIDVELDDMSDDSTSMDGGSENDDDNIASLTGMDVEALESAGDSDDNSSDEEMADAGNRGSSYAKKKVAPQKRKLGAKSGRSPFASLEEYEHLMAGDAGETALKRKRKATGRAGGENKPKLRSHEKSSEMSSSNANVEPRRY